MTTPVLTFGDYVVCFDALKEYQSARDHFIRECGWTPEQFRMIKDLPFFTAKVSIWRDGDELASDYLGACSYKTESEFYTLYCSEYFADMVGECVKEVDELDLSTLYEPWKELMRKEHARKSAIAQKVHA
jgi:hypothetical protein